MMGWCNDNRRDRTLGQIAEQEAFERILGEGLTALRHPYGITGPDIIVHHNDEQHVVEVRCKRPDKLGRFGLEQPKYEQWCERDVIYLIKDTDRRQWVWVRVRDLSPPQPGPAGSYARDGTGRADHARGNDYWPAYCWTPLCWDYTA